MLFCSAENSRVVELPAHDVHGDEDHDGVPDDDHHHGADEGHVEPALVAQPTMGLHSVALHRRKKRSALLF